MITATPQHYSASPFIQTPSSSNNLIYTSNFRNGIPHPHFYLQHQQQQQQYFPISQNHFAFSPVVATAAMSPIFHNHHPAMVAFQHNNMYQQQAPVNTFYANPQFHKIPIYNQQPQTIPVASLISSFTSHNLPSYATSPATNLKHTPSHSKTVTLKASQSSNANISPVPSFAASHVEHNEGAVSFAHFSTPSASSTNGEQKKVSIPPQQQQHQHHQHQLSHYNNHAQPILSPAYSKLVQYVPTSTHPLNHFSTQNDYANNVPFSYAHLNKAVPSASSFSPQQQHGSGALISSSSPKAAASLPSTVSHHHQG